MEEKFKNSVFQRVRPRRRPSTAKEAAPEALSNPDVSPTALKMTQSAPRPFSLPASKSPLPGAPAFAWYERGGIDALLEMVLALANSHKSLHVSLGAAQQGLDKTQQDLGKIPQAVLRIVAPIQTQLSDHIRKREAQDEEMLNLIKSLGEILEKRQQKLGNHLLQQHRQIVNEHQASIESQMKQFQRQIEEFNRENIHTNHILAEAQLLVLQQQIDDLNRENAHINDLLNDLIQQHLQEVQQKHEEADRKEKQQRTAFETTWKAASLSLQLEYVQGILEAEHPWQVVLKEARQLEELRRRGRELETWLRAYPSLFADAVARITVGVPASDDIGILLAHETLSQARDILNRDLEAMGVEWIIPRVGDPLSDEMEVMAEQEAPHLAKNTVAQVYRPGLRIQGKVALSALILRVGTSSKSLRPTEMSTQQEERKPPTTRIREAAMEEKSDLSKHARSDPGGSTGLSGKETSRSMVERWPLWLRTLQQHRLSLSTAAVEEIMEALEQLVEISLLEKPLSMAAARGLTQPLLPFLGPYKEKPLDGLPAEWAKAYLTIYGEMQDWLSTNLGFEILAPKERTLFQANSMEISEERRTGHKQEHGTVARLERAGIRQGAELLWPARVVVYSTGGTL